MASQRAAAGGILLADEPQFRFGAFEIRPSLLEIQFLNDRVSVEPRVMQVLTLLAKANGRTVSRDELVERCWAGRAVGEDAINRTIARIRKLASLDDGRSFALETIPRVGYRLQEQPHLSTDTDRREDHIDVEVASITSTTLLDRRHALIALVTASVLACGTATLWVNRPTAVAVRPRIAVLPFDADQPDQRAIADGLVDALIGALVTVAEIDVVARSSTFALRGGRKADAARLLGATHLIDGAVSRLGGIETATLDLIDAATQTTLWSRQYPVTSTTLPLLRTRVMRDTTAITRQSVEVPPASLAIDPTSYRLFLQGRGLLLQDPPQPRDAVSVLQEALARTPGYSAGWTTLGDAYLLAQPPIDPSGSASAERGLAADAARQAIRTDPGNAEAHALLAAATDRNGRWQAVEVLLDKALALGASSPDVLYRAGSFHADVGSNDRAIDLLQRAWTLDPLNTTAAFLLLRVLAAAGREAELKTFLLEVRGQFPDDLAIWRFAACQASFHRRFDEVEA